MTYKNGRASSDSVNLGSNDDNSELVICCSVRPPKCSARCLRLVPYRSALRGLSIVRCSRMKRSAASSNERLGFSPQATASRSSSQALRRFSAIVRSAVLRLRRYSRP